MQRRHDPALGDEPVAAPREVLRHLGRAWHHGDTVLAYGQGGRQILLDGNFAIELDVARPVGNAEAALTQHGQDFMAPDQRAHRQGDEIDIRIGRRRL